VLRGKKYRPIVRKIRFLVFVGELKKNVTRQTWRALFHFGEYLFQSNRHFGECLKKMVSHTDTIEVLSELKYDNNVLLAYYMCGHK